MGGQGVSAPLKSLVDVYETIDGKRFSLFRLKNVYSMNGILYIKRGIPVCMQL